MFLSLRALILILVVLTFVGTKLSGLYVLCVHERENIVHYEVLNLSEESDIFTAGEVHVNIDDFLTPKEVDLSFPLVLPALFVNFPVRRKLSSYKIKITIPLEPINKTVRLLI